MHNDDHPVGRSLTRREMVALFGGSAAIAAVSQRAAGQAPAAAFDQVAPDCVALPRQTEGPFFVDEQLRRSDIRLDPATGITTGGIPLELHLAVSQVTASRACAVLPGAQVDIWHCDAAGVYSDVRNRDADTTGRKFLRGYQVTDANGRARFTTIYPGWYSGRAVHIHFKIRVPSAAGRTDEFTSQFYFNDELTDTVHARAPYSAHRGQRLVNARDMIFREGGAQLLLPVVDEGEGYGATYRIAMSPGEPAARFGRGGGGSRR